MTARTSTASRPQHLLSFAPVHRLRSSPPLVMRAVTGAVMVIHGTVKLTQGPADFGNFLQTLDVPAPMLMSWGVSIGETLAGVLLILGLFTRLTSVMLTVHLSLAIFLVNADTGFITPQQGTASGTGVEFPLLLMAVLIGLLLSGPGPLALDRALGIEGEPRTNSHPSPNRTPRTATSTPSPVRAALIGGVIGGVIGAAMSALANYLVVGVPSSAGTNAANHAVSGLISGFLAGFLGLLMHQRKHGGLSGGTAMRPEDRDDDTVQVGPSSPSVPGA